MPWENGELVDGAISILQDEKVHCFTTLSIYSKLLYVMLFVIFSTIKKLAQDIHVESEPTTDFTVLSSLVDLNENVHAVRRGKGSKG